jgi:hypothetical protein
MSEQKSEQEITLRGWIQPCENTSNVFTWSVPSIPMK